MPHARLLVDDELKYKNIKVVKAIVEINYFRDGTSYDDFFQDLTLTKKIKH